MRTGIQCLIVFAFALLGGCGGQSDEALWDQIHTLNEQRNELRSQVERLEAENRRLREENRTLLAIGPEEHRAAMDRLDRVAVRRRSGLYDKDNDGRAETLVIYLETIDSAQDRVKAPGEIEVTLWNLRSSAEQALLGRWTVSPEELKSLWSDSVLTHCYRLSFDAGDRLTGDEKELTVTVKFTDILTGKVLTDQYVFTP